MLKKPVVSPDKWILRRSSWTIACTWITHPAQNAAAHPNKRPPIRIQTEGLHTYGTRGSSFFSTRENQFKRWGWNCFGKTDCCKKLGKSVTYRFETWCVGNVLLKTVFLGIFQVISWANNSILWQNSKIGLWSSTEYRTHKNPSPNLKKYPLLKILSSFSLHTSDHTLDT